MSRQERSSAIAHHEQLNYLTLLVLAPTVLALTRLNNITLLYTEEDEFKSFHSLETGENKDSTHAPEDMRIDVPKGGTAVARFERFKVLLSDFKGRGKKGDAHAFIEYGGRVRKIITRRQGQKSRASYRMMDGFRINLDMHYSFNYLEGTGIETFYDQYRSPRIPDEV